MGVSMRWLRLGTKMLSVEVAIIALFVVPALGYAAFTASKSINTNPDLQSGLVGWWTFDGANLIQNAVDSGSGGNTGRLINMSTTTVQGPVGQALDFDGSNDYVDAGSAANLDIVNGTVSVWFKRSALLGATDTGILGKDAAGNNNGDFSLSFGVAQCGDNDFLCFYQSDGATDKIVLSDAVISAGRWHHAVAVFGAGGMILYVDGAQQADTDAFSGGMISGSPSFIIGSIRSGLGPFNGSVDDVRIYNRVLSAAEIKRLYEVGATAKIAASPKSGLASPTQADGISNGLVGWWTFDGPNLLQNVVDSSNNGYHAFLNGFTSTTTTLGKVGQALTFSGSASEVQTFSTSPGNAFGTTPFSVFMWVKTTAGGYIIGKRAGCAHGHFWDVRVLAAGTVQVELDDSNVNYNLFASNGKVNDDKWHHVGFVRSGVTASIYIDGVFDSSNDTSGTTNIASNGATLWIGNSGPDGGLCDIPFAGPIDDVRIYNRALSAEEVKRIYDIGATAHVGVTPDTGTASAAGSGLVGHWTFDGPKLLQNATDSSGQGNNGQLLSFTSTTTAIGKIGQALQFDGTDDYIQTPVNLAAATDFTLSGWFKADATDFAHLIFWQGVSSGNGWGLADEMHLAIGSLADGSATTISNELSFTYMDSGAGNPSASDLNARITFTDTSKWHHVAAVVSGLATSPNVDLWLDGVVVASDTGTATLSGAGWDTNLRIGRPGLSTRLFDGMLDDMRVYNRALSAAEVLRLYQLGL